MLCLVLLLVLLSPPVPPATGVPRLTVRPAVGIAPMETAIRASVRPGPTDRQLEVVALLDAEPAMVVARAERDVQTGQPVVTVNLLWRLDAGTYAIVACVTGRHSGRCVEARVVVR